MGKQWISLQQALKNKKIKKLNANNQILHKTKMQTLDFEFDIDANHTFNELMTKRPIKFGQIYDGNNEKKKEFEQSFLSQIGHRFDAFMQSATKRESEFIFDGIPRIIHQIWLGPQPIPSQYRFWSESWIEKHPNWKYMLWTDESLKNEALFEWNSSINRSLFEICTNYGEKSDILRLEILYKIGGVYVDLDIDCNISCFVGLSNSGFVEINNAIFGSKPRNKLLSEIWSSIHLICKDDKTKNTLLRTGPIRITRCIMNLYQKYKDNLLIFPTIFFYPFPNNMRYLPIVDRFRYYNDCTLAVHHWGCSWNDKLKNKVTVNCNQQRNEEKEEEKEINVIDSIMNTNDSILLQSKI